MAVSKGDLLAHFKYLQKSIDEAGAEAILSMANFSVLIRRGKHDRVLYPQFLAVTDNVKQYTQTFGMNARQFIGWLPYYNKRWEIAANKLSFKTYAAANGIRVPSYSVDSAAEMRNVIVKRNASSFGAQIRGPFKSSRETVLDASRGEFFEQFIEGKIAKAWYWNQTPVCMELDAMPALIGDGTSTIRELARKRLRSQKRALADAAKQASLEDSVLQKVEHLALYSGHALDSVLPHRQRLLADFRYASELALPSYRQIIDLRAKMPNALGAQLWTIGKTLLDGIPRDSRQNTLFTVDAILDPENRLWALEMNSNPYVHPLAYPLIVPTLFRSQETVVAAAAVH